MSRYRQSRPAVEIPTQHRAHHLDEPPPLLLPVAVILSPLVSSLFMFSTASWQRLRASIITGNCSARRGAWFPKIRLRVGVEEDDAPSVTGTIVLFVVVVVVARGYRRDLLRAGRVRDVDDGGAHSFREPVTLYALHDCKLGEVDVHVRSCSAGENQETAEDARCVFVRKHRR